MRARCSKPMGTRAMRPRSVVPIRGTNSASGRVAAHREITANVRVVATNRHRRVEAAVSVRRVEAAVSVRRARLAVPIVTGGADERGTSKTSRNTRGDAVSAREGSAGYP